MPEVSIGQTAFEACQAYIAEHVPDDIPEIAEGWAELPEIYKCAWEAAASAVIDRAAAEL
jgi:hypothetical protein